MKIALLTIGCRLNQSETESITTTLKNRGHQVQFTPEGADTVIINSCAVTGRSQRKTRNLAFRGTRALQQTGKGIVIVTGCGAETLTREGNVINVPNDYKYLIPDLADGSIQPEEIGTRPALRFKYDMPLLARRNRVNLKIQDGCDTRCSYCIIPDLRGSSVSRPSEDILNEFRKLLEYGYREIILTGVQIGRYRHEDTTLAGLVEGLLDVEGDYRIHIPSIAPMFIEDRLIELFARPRMVKHMNLSLQSGSDRILELMGRAYTREKYLGIISAVRNVDPLFNLTTDIIVGFPGETEEDFLQTAELIREAAFTHIHTFRYSPRPGTPAALMENPVSDNLKNDRSREVIGLYGAQKLAYYKLFEGKKAVLLTEKISGNKTTGHTEYYIPVIVDEGLERNSFHEIHLFHSTGEECMRGKPALTEEGGRGTLNG